jgi:hypothetical protein
VRVSSPAVSSFEALAAVALTRISPAPALEARREVKFAESPTAVKSHASLPHPPDVCDPRVDTRPDLDPGIGRVVSGLGHESARGGNGLLRVVLASEHRDEERDHLVADELVHDPVLPVDDLGRGAVEAGDEPGELVRGDPLRQGSRSADVREEKRDLDLGASRALLERANARSAETPVEPRRPVPHEPEHRAAGTSERGRAELAAGLGRDPAERPPDRRQPRDFAEEQLAPGFVVRAPLDVHRLGHEASTAGSRAGTDSR